MKTPRIGAIGGGQLARMMTPPAIHLGLDFKVLAEAEGSSAGLAVTMVGDYNKVETVREFADTVDVVTFDHEHVPLDVLPCAWWLPKRYSKFVELIIYPIHPWP